MKNIWKNAIVQEAWKKGSPVWVHGWIAHLETGYIDEIRIDEAMPKTMDIYKFDFNEAIQI
jgi:carbonic anhydrase